jgi:aspartokinase-like uncharacterized kinase
MSQPACTVIKVGGSLYDLPDLAARLRCLMESIDSPRVILFPGGGAAADVVRDLDSQHRLGAESAHWLALRALTVNAYFLQALLPELPVAAWPAVPDRLILEPYAFALADESAPGHLPHTWDVTSDSLAARAAYILGAQELLLLKSIAANGLTWQAAASTGLVDTHFPEVLARMPELNVRMMCLRDVSPV